MSPRKKKGSTLPPLRDPRTGRFVQRTVKAARAVVKAVARDYKRAVQDRTKWAKKRREGAKLPSTRRKYDREYRKAAKRVAVRETQLLKAQEQMPRPRAPRLPRVMEIGLTYAAAKGIASDVNVNFRVRRTDGRGVSEDDARRALFAIGAGESALPDDLEISGVDWQRPQKATRAGQATWRHGEPDDIWSFHAIISTMLFPSAGVDYSGFRFGHVKEDEL